MSIIEATISTQVEADEHVANIDLKDFMAMMQLSTVTVSGSEWVGRVTEGHRRWQASILGL